MLSRVFGSGCIRVSDAGRLSLQDVVSKVCNRLHGPVRVHKAFWCDLVGAEPHTMIKP